MSISKKITRLEHSSVRLAITIGKDEVQSRYDGIVNEYAKTIQIPGFRKGKVPRNVLIMKFRDVLQEETLEKLVEETITSLFEDESFPKENKPLPYSTPKVEGEPKLDLDADLSFAVTYDVMPKVNVGVWQGLEVEVPGVSITKEDISRELEELRERNAIVLDKNEGAAAVPGDVVTINYSEIDEAGGEVPGTGRQDFVFTLGSGYNIYKFDDDVAGMKKGETKEFEKTYPADNPDQELAGKTKKLRITVTALKTKKLPELDDDLAQDVDEKYKTLEDLKKSIRERLEKDLEERLRELKINKILEKIMENTPVDIPESMTNLELDSRWRRLARNFGTDSEGLSRMMERINNGGEGPQAMIEKWRPNANRALHSRLIIETLIEREKIEAEDAELEAEMESRARISGIDMAELREHYKSPEAREYLKEDVKERKIFDRLLAENTVKTAGKQKYIDLISKNE